MSSRAAPQWAYNSRGASFIADALSRPTGRPTSRLSSQKLTRRRSQRSGLRCAWEKTLQSLVFLLATGSQLPETSLLATSVHWRDTMTTARISRFLHQFNQETAAVRFLIITAMLSP